MRRIPYNQTGPSNVANLAARLALVTPLIALTSTACFAEDSCAALLPPELSEAATAAYPGYRPPRESDNLKEDVALWRASGSSPCLGLTQGNVYGDGQLAYILRMAGPAEAWVVAAARKIGDHWSFEQIVKSPNGRNNLYVAIAAAGVYRANSSENGGIEKSINCQHSVVLIGAAEASETAYCRDVKGWRALPLGD